MRQVGLAPERYRDAVRTDLDAFVELHIEQGRILFDEGLPLGIVDTITGLYRFRMTVEGRTDHAGTTPMDLRLRRAAGCRADRARDDAHRRAGWPTGGRHQRLVGRPARRVEHRARPGPLFGRPAPS